MPQTIMDRVCRPVELEPFVHQVGGHSSMLKFDETTVCKPLTAREHKFYETMPKEIRKFTPEYRGVVQVSFKEDDDGYLTLVAFPCENDSVCIPRKSIEMPSHSHFSSNLSNSGGEEGKSDSDSEAPTVQPGVSGNKQRFRIQKSGSIEIEGLPDKMKSVMEQAREKEKIQASGHNPWSLYCHKQQLAKMHKNVQDSKEDHKFILLENVASQYEYPCILDLKMGRRQHGDDASEKKRQRQVEKCEMTTSYRLGVRICGMQVYQRDTGNFMFHNKYHGRKLDESGFQKSIKQFLHNGYHLRLDLIGHIIDKLSELHGLVEKQNTFRFYSSSLLIMYDGNEPSADDMLMDYDEHSSESANSTGFPDHSFRHGEVEENLYVNGSNVKPVINQSVHCVHHPTTSSTLNQPCQVCSHNAGVEEQLQTSHRMLGGLTGESGPSKSSTSGQSPKPTVDVRMIDFAHSTYLGFRGDKTKHEGPDHGYLFGLSNLINIFKAIKDEFTSPCDE